MAASKIVVFGDSVNWGQGLLTQHKFSTLVREGLASPGTSLTVQMLAHSGATIGVRGPGTTTRIDGEVPVSSPTVMEQVALYDDDPDDVAVIILNGGINDVDIRVILNPLTTQADLRHDIQQFCYHDMLVLLKAVAARFPTTAPMVVTGYYPVLSNKSHPLRIPFLLETYGVGFPFFLDQNLVFAKIVALSMQFWSESSVALQHAVMDCNTFVGADRVKYAAVPFTVDNAVFADQPWLFGLDGEFNPQDEVIAERRAACNLNIEPNDIFGREGCYRASAGHPNTTGAVAYANAIIASV
jgi:hypothetical protein